MNDTRRSHGLVLTEDISKLGQAGYVFYSTIKSFKGLECRHVIFIHADKPDVTQALGKEDLYVAFTRASARLDVVTANLEAADWLSSLRLTVV
jgi:DNA helicase IV